MKFIFYILIELIFIVVLLFLRSSNILVNIIDFSNNAHSEILINFIIFVLALDLFRRVAIVAYSRNNKQSFYTKDNFQFGINNMAKFILGIGTIVAIFGFFGIDFRSLLTSLSIVAAAIAIISKDYLNDFIVGLYYSFSKDIEINDYIQIANTKGKVIEIQMLKIKILNDDDDLIIIPNSKIYNNEIINYTKRDIRSLSIDFQIAIDSIKNIELLESELISTLQNFEEYVETNSFNLKIVEMKKDYIDLKFQYTLKNLDRDLQKKIRKKTIREIFNYISERTLSENKQVI